MDLTRILRTAGVPVELHAQATYAFRAADERNPSVLYKHYVRWLRAHTIARQLTWEDNWLPDDSPYKKWDIAPMLNITCNGDNPEWINTPEGPRPNPNSWLNPDPTSDEYKRAVAACYWAPGHHPRSYEARVAWYMRNACEYTAWERGAPINPALAPQVWSQNGIDVLRCGDVWQAHGTLQIAGPLHWRFDIGFEVGNVFARIDGRLVQGWYPRPGYDLRACVCHVVYPVILKTEV